MATFSRNKMKINLHMLSALMLNGVGGYIHSADIIAVDECAPRRWSLELMEQLTQPSGLNHVVGDDAILDLCAGVGDDSLSLGRPRHQVAP
jgi:hypothetical protein